MIALHLATCVLHVALGRTLQNLLQSVYQRSSLCITTLWVARHPFFIDKGSLLFQEPTGDLPRLILIFKNEFWLAAMRRIIDDLVYRIDGNQVFSSIAIDSLFKTIESD